MSNEVTGEISLKHRLSEDTEITLDTNTDDDVKLGFEFKVSEDATVSVEHGNDGHTDAKVTIQI
jgi:hypothetical protein